MSGSFVNSMSLRALAIVASGLVLSGCSANQYFMVEKKDISQLSQSVSDQNQQLERFEEVALGQLDAITRLNETGTESILEAIKEQAETFSCPPVPAPPEQPACEATERGESPAGSDTDRLKGMVIVGQLERFYLPDPGMVHVARIDSGAETSSIDARNITRFERDGSNWVRFDIPMPDTDDLVTLEREVSRRVRIIQASTDETDNRVVVELQFMIGDHRQQAEFTLTSREHLSQTVLVGRNILRDVMLVDVGREFTTELPTPLPHQKTSN